MGRARGALQALAKEYPDDDVLMYFGAVVNAFEGRSTVPFDCGEAALRARQALSREVQPAVARVFARQSGATWLAPLWAELAGRAARCAAFPCGPRRCARGAALPACCEVGQGL